MKSKCFLVTGGESTGTNLLVRSFGMLDIHELKYDLNANWSYDDIQIPDGNICIHAGLPSAGTWPSLWTIAKRMRNEDKEVIPLVMVREWNAVTQSQVKRRYVNSIREAEENLRAAYRRITQQLTGYIFVSYEQFCLQPKYRVNLFSRFGLNNPNIDIHYGNDQYYD